MTLVYAGGDIIRFVSRSDSGVEEIRERLLEEFEQYEISFDFGSGIKSRKILEKGLGVPKVYDWTAEYSLRKDQYYDHYNGYFVDECDEIVYEHEIEPEFISHYDTLNYNISGDLIYMMQDSRYCYFRLDHHHDLYACDHCDKMFLDYNKQIHQFLSNNDSRISEILRISDCCYSCYSEYVTDKRKETGSESGKKAVETLHRLGKIPSSKQQRYLCNLLGGRLNFRIKSYFVDMLIDDKFVVEYDGSGHWLGARYSNKTIEEIDNADLIRDRELIGLGYKVIRIISTRDLLPDDASIKELIDQSVIQLRQNKDKVVLNIDEMFDKVGLRRIENETP